MILRTFKQTSIHRLQNVLTRDPVYPQWPESGQWSCAIINDLARANRGENFMIPGEMKENPDTGSGGNVLMVLYQTPTDHLTPPEHSRHFIINLPWSFLVCKQLYWQLRGERFHDGANRANCKISRKTSRWRESIDCRCQMQVGLASVIRRSNI